MHKCTYVHMYINNAVSVLIVGIVICMLLLMLVSATAIVVGWCECEWMIMVI